MVLSTIFSSARGRTLLELQRREENFEKS